MDEKMRQEIALHRWAVIAEAANTRLTSSERGSVVRAIAARHRGPGHPRQRGRGTSANPAPPAKSRSAPGLPRGVRTAAAPRPAAPRRTAPVLWGRQP
jgi:hypothetical protein